MIGVWFWILAYVLFPFYTIGIFLGMRKLHVKLQKRNREKCTERVRGICVDKYKRYKKGSLNYSDGSHLFYYNVWEYAYCGKIRRSRIKLETTSQWAEIGEQVDLLVNPDRPREIMRLESEVDNYTIRKSNIKFYFIIIIICWLLFGVVMVSGGLI